MTLSLKLLVFDWDGTLMDSEAKIVNSMRAAIDDCNAALRSNDELRHIIGLGMQEAIRALYPRCNDDFVETFADAYRRHFLEEDETPTGLFDGVGDVLENLAAEGYLLAVATGKARRGLDKVFASTGLGELFHASRCADETFSKPHPQMLEEIVTDLDVSPDAALMIGDTEYDLLMAANAGMHALAVSYGVHSLEHLLQYNPLGYLDNIRELPAWLKSGGEYL